MAAQEQQDNGRSPRPRLHRGDDTMMAAERAAAEKNDMEEIKQNVCQWLSETLQLDITPDNFLDVLETGVELCRLVELIQEKARAMDLSEEDKSKLKVNIPLEPIKYSGEAKKTSFHAREKIEHFLGWCHELGIPKGLIFETNDLVDRTNEKRVLLCLLQVSRYARRVNIKPPDIVIKEEEANEKAEVAEPVHEGVIENADSEVTSEPVVEGVIKKAEEMAGPVVEEIEANRDAIRPVVQEVEANGHGDAIRLGEQEADVVTKPTHSAGQDKLPQPPVSSDRDNKSERRFQGAIPRLLDRCSYPVFFSLLLLVLLVGGGVYWRRRR